MLHPELVFDALSAGQSGSKKRLSTISGWPYLDSLPLSDIDNGVIERLVHATLNRGYSTQMARQIRNVMSSIMSHAIRTGYYAGPNPAKSITLPAIPQRVAHALNSTQLISVLQAMSYPEKHIALFAILTKMRVTEICGLQWKYVNISAGHRLVDGELIHPKTIAVRNQIYRGEFTEAFGSRRRFVRIPDLLSPVLRELRGRERFNENDNFVLVSRNGTPVHPENIAARRLKSIGASLGMPWLSWSVFVRTRALLASQSDLAAYEQLQRFLVSGSE